MDGETLWMKDSPLIGIWMWHRCYEQCSCLDDDRIELGLVLRDYARSSSFSLSPPTVIAHLINETYELWSTQSFSFYRNDALDILHDYG